MFGSGCSQFKLEQNCLETGCLPLDNLWSKVRDNLESWKTSMFLVQSAIADWTANRREKKQTTNIKQDKIEENGSLCLHNLGDNSDDRTSQVWCENSWCVSHKCVVLASKHDASALFFQARVIVLWSTATTCSQERPVVVLKFVLKCMNFTTELCVWNVHYGGLKLSARAPVVGLSDNPGK